MKFKVLNLTNGNITVSTSRSHEAATLLFLAPKKQSLLPHRGCSHIYLHRLDAHVTESEKAHEVFEVPLPGLWAKRGASWKELTTQAECPWKVYCFWPQHTLVVLPHRKLESFLSDMPDSLSLSALVLPGTHDTMAFYGWPISQCQSPITPLSTQFLTGIRVIDIRLAAIPSPGTAGDSNTAAPHFNLIAYHGVYPQRTPFPTILNSIHTFLTSPAGKRETIVMSLKQEDYTVTPAPIFSRLVKEDLMRGPGGFKDTDAKGNRDTGIYFLENRLPTLGEVRGKVVLLSRFGGNGVGWEGGLEGIGIHPTTWPDSEKTGFVWDLKGTTVRTHDWYDIPTFLTIPEKASLATQVLKPAVAFPLTIPAKGSAIPVSTTPPPSNVSQSVLNITYLSAASFPLALPPTIARGSGWPGFKLGFEGVNARVGRWLLEALVPEFTSTASPSPNAATANDTKVTAENNANGKVDEDRKAKLRWFKGKNSDSTSPPSPATQNAQAETVSDSVRLRGWAFMDYYSSDKGLVSLLVECNYRARKSGEEGWV